MTSVATNTVEQSKLLGYTGVMITVILVFLDTQIVNAALEKIAASVGASLDKISFIQTAYLIGEAIGILIASIILKAFSAKNTAFYATLVFGFSSVLTGNSETFSELVFFRLIQGVSGGIALPAATYLRYSLFNKELLPIILLVSGLALLSARAIGLSIGGEITEAVGWPWIFYINVPPTLLAAYAVKNFLPFKKPPANSQVSTTTNFLILFILLFLTIEVFQHEFTKSLTDAPNRLASITMILIMLFGLVILKRDRAKTVLNFDLFDDDRFRRGMILLSLFYVVQFGSTLLLVLHLAVNQEYAPKQYAIFFSTLAIIQFSAALLLFYLIRNLKLNDLMLIGFLALLLSMLIGFTIQKDWGYPELFIMLLGIGVGTIFVAVPLSMYAFDTIDASKLIDASVFSETLISLSATIGAFFSISLATYLTKLNRSWLLSSTISNNDTQLGFNVAISIYSVAEAIATSGAIGIVFLVLSGVCLLSMVFLIAEEYAGKRPK